MLVDLQEKEQQKYCIVYNSIIIIILNVIPVKFIKEVLLNRQQTYFIQKSTKNH